MDKKLINYINIVQKDFISKYCYCSGFRLMKQSMIFTGIIHIVNEKFERFIPITIILFQTIHIDNDIKYLYKFKTNKIELRYIRFDKFYKKVKETLKNLKL